MKELFIALLISLGGTPLPDIVDTGFIQKAQVCMMENIDVAFNVQKCKSMQFPEKTFHIYEYSHHHIDRYGYIAFDNYEKVNVFVKNGVVFEILLEDLFKFYQLELK